MVFVGVLFVMVEIYVCKDCFLLSFIFLRNLARNFLNSTKFSVVGFLFALLNAFFHGYLALFVPPGCISFLCVCGFY